MYMDLLERAVQSIKLGKQPDLDRPLETGTEIDLHIPSLIPEDYLPDVHSRLIMYKRVASAKDDHELLELQEEMIDRFGLLPESVKNLFQVAGLKLIAKNLGIKKVDLGKNGGRVVFGEETSIDPSSLIKLIQNEPQVYKLDGSFKLKITSELVDTEARFALLSQILDSISHEKHAA